jgi:hypothetical protein
VPSLIGQRIFAIALGYEDINDHDHLRHDRVLQVLEVPTAKWSELRYGLRGQLEDHDGEASQA